MKGNGRNKKNTSNSTKIQTRINDDEKKKFEEIRQVLFFENNSGNRLTPYHPYATEDKVTDADVIKYLINSYKHND